LTYGPNALDFGSEVWHDRFVNRLLSKLRKGQQPQASAGNGVGHGHLVTDRSALARSSYVLTAAETAPCTCPDFCERDHDNE
jgi:hypothetical protein